MATLFLCCIINDDLNKFKDYESLFEAIKSYDTWAKILKSCWAIVTTKSAEQVRDHLLTALESDTYKPIVQQFEIG